MKKLEEITVWNRTYKLGDEVTVYSEQVGHMGEPVKKLGHITILMPRYCVLTYDSGVREAWHYRDIGKRFDVESV